MTWRADFLLPPPLWGRVAEGGGECGTGVAPRTTPTPNPSPQGGGEQSSAASAVTSWRRREFIALLGAAPAIWPLAARGQPTKKLPTIGFLGSGTPSTMSQWTAAFERRLRELGWTEGRNVAIEYRWAEGRSERYTEIVTEFVRLKVDVIIVSGAASVLAARQVTTVIPIIFPVATDPVGSGLVASLARPGGNVTGLSFQGVDLVGKRLELLREVVPGLGRLGVMANTAAPGAVIDMGEVQAMANKLGLKVATLEVRRMEDIAPVIEARKDDVDALYVCADPLMTTNRIRINTLALSARLPTMDGNREYVEAGGLMSYGTNFPDLFRRAADFVDKILRGAKPADIPVEQPTRFDRVINLITAKALGLTVPPMLLARADEVIE